jgi:glycosyltransferase involved in cell wall biosynthesis
MEDSEPVERMSSQGVRSGISVAVPTRARPELLHKCLSSVARQTRRPDEVVVSQDGVDEKTREVVARFAGELPIRHLQNNSPLGQLRNRTQAFAASRHEFVAMLDDDDEWEPGFLERTAAALGSHPECAFCTTDHYLISQDGAVLLAESDAYSATYGRARFRTAVHNDVLARELRHTCYSLVTSLFRREALVEVGFFPDDTGTAVDLGLFLELGARGLSCVYLDERLGRYRIHPLQNTHRAGRLHRSASHVSTLLGFAGRHELPHREREILAARYRAAVLELAISSAHTRDRVAAASTLRRYGELGWGPPSPARVGVLLALLVGVRRSQRKTLAKRPWPRGHR